MSGRLFINGNHGSPSTLLSRIGEHLRGSWRGPPRVLLVTAAWGPGELGEAGLRGALQAAGFPSRWEGGHDQQIRNLCAWHEWQRSLESRPNYRREMESLLEVEAATRRFYVEKTTFLARRVRETAAACRRLDPSFGLGSLPALDRDPLRADNSLPARGLFLRALSRELLADLGDLRHNDARLLRTLAEAEDALAERTGLRLDPSWADRRAAMERQILESDLILIPGGDPGSLLSSLRYFDLRPAFVEALRRGATFVTISAGSLLLGERVILYDDFHPDPTHREFQLHARGFGLVGGLQILPHCEDRIQTDDSDNLAYLARRFSSHLCVGLNEESFLLAEPGAGTARSIGERDGVYVFGADGVKWRYHRGESMPLDA